MSLSIHVSQRPKLMVVSLDKLVSTQIWQTHAVIDEAMQWMLLHKNLDERPRTKPKGLKTAHAIASASVSALKSCYLLHEHHHRKSSPAKKPQGDFHGNAELRRPGFFHQQKTQHHTNYMRLSGKECIFASQEKSSLLQDLQI